VGEYYELDKGPQYDLESIRRKKKLQKKKRKRRKIKVILSLVLFTGVVSGAGLSPFFNIVAINVKDTPHYTQDEIRAYVQPLIGINGFRTVFTDYVDMNRVLRFRLAATEDKLSHTLPYIDKVKVSYFLPSKINISISEREPFAVVKSGDKTILIDKSGYVLEEIKENKNNYVQINGLENVNTNVGQYFCDNHTEVMDLANNILSSLSDLDANEQNKLVPLINSINLGDIRKVKLFIDSRLVVVLGDVRNEDILRYRGNYLKQLVFKFISKNDKGTVDFTMGEDPRFIPNKLN
jgi:Cell division septal protein